MRLGMYTDAGLLTCARYPGSLGHEEQDAATFARWGVGAQSVIALGVNAQSTITLACECARASNRPAQGHDLPSHRVSLCHCTCRVFEGGQLLGGSSDGCAALHSNGVRMRWCGMTVGMLFYSRVLIQLTDLPPLHICELHHALPPRNAQLLPVSHTLPAGVLFRAAAPHCCTRCAPGVWVRPGWAGAVKLELPPGEPLTTYGPSGPAC